MSHITVKAVRTFVRDLHVVTLDELAFHLFDNQADAISSVSRQRIHHTLIADGWRVRRVRDGEGKPARTYHYDRPKHAIPAAINLIPASGDPEAIPAGRRYTLIEQVPTAITILQDAHQAILDRAATRDLDAERSMARAVTAFNAITGLRLTETQGWLFMVQLKAARATAGALNVDDYVDGAGYFGLAGECAAREQAGAA